MPGMSGAFGGKKPGRRAALETFGVREADRDGHNHFGVDDDRFMDSTSAR